ncbi:MAG TPA: hypothetical protein PLC74_11850 [Acetobacteraceae bacterium]|nr:hypothetical protein [Acetobacteraceae bacterium]
MNDTKPGRPAGKSRGWLWLVILLLIVLGLGGGGLWFKQHLAAEQAGQAAAQDQASEALRDELAQLQQQMAALTAKQDAAPTPSPTMSPAASAEIAALTSEVAALKQSVAADHASLAALQGGLGDMPRLAARAQSLSLVALAAVHLRDGQKLGVIPGAPASLAQFADTAPPTMTQLRLSFEQAAAQALEAGGEAAKGDTMWHRAIAHLENLITIRRGNDVIVGSRAAGPIALARSDLAAGDLAGAVTALGGLNDQAKAAMSGWLGQAQSLLDAQAALNNMVAAAVPANPPADTPPVSSPGVK